MDEHEQRVIGFGAPPAGWPWLMDGGFQLDRRPFSAIADIDDKIDLIVVNGQNDGIGARDVCRRLKTAYADVCPPIAFIASEPAQRIDALLAGADCAMSSKGDAGEIRSQLQAMIRQRTTSRRLAAKAGEANLFNERLQKAYQQMNGDMAVARRLQTSFLPAQMPEVGRIRFHSVWSPCGEIGGDFFDVMRLDEHHVGFYLADAMGHGVPASLLTIFLKKAVVPKEVNGSQYRLLPPDEVLTRLNREFKELQLDGMPFITIVYGLIDTRDGRLQFARAGHPLPVYLPAVGPAVVWEAHGRILGVFDAEFATRSERLDPGDRLVLTTDGVWSGRSELAPQDQDMLLQAVEKWRDQPAAKCGQAIVGELTEDRPAKDDVTLLIIESQATP